MKDAQAHPEVNGFYVKEKVFYKSGSNKVAPTPFRKRRKLSLPHYLYQNEEKKWIIALEVHMEGTERYHSLGENLNDTEWIASNTGEIDTIKVSSYNQKCNI